MASFGDTLKAKRGPLPTWGWALLFVAVLFAFFKYRASKAAAAENTASTDSSTPAASSGAAAGTASSTTTPAAFAMPYSGGDTFVNNLIPAPATTTTTTPVAAAPKPVATPTAPVKQQSYITAKGDTWDSIGKKLNIAPVLLWEANGAPAGNPLAGKNLNITGLINNPKDVYANQASIVAAEKTLAAKGTPPPKQGSVVTS